MRCCKKTGEYQKDGWVGSDISDSRSIEPGQYTRVGSDISDGRSLKPGKGTWNSSDISDGQSLKPGKCTWGGQRERAGRKKTCLKKVPFNRRINENILNILREFAASHGLTETEALESAILLQNNLDKLKGDKNMIIAIPTENGKLCAHFGHCESFSFAEINPETNEIISIEEKIPEDGISCQSASWIAQQGANMILAGGMGMRPLMIFEQNGVRVIPGCPELPVKEVIEGFLSGKIEQGENSCGGEHHHCHGHHGEEHGCRGHHHG